MAVNKAHRKDRKYTNQLNLSHCGILGPPLSSPILCFSPCSNFSKYIFSFSSTGFLFLQGFFFPPGSLFVSLLSLLSSNHLPHPFSFIPKELPNMASPSFHTSVLLIEQLLPCILSLLYSGHVTHVF